MEDVQVHSKLCPMITRWLSGIKRKLGSCVFA